MMSNLLKNIQSRSGLFLMFDHFNCDTLQFTLITNNISNNLTSNSIHNRLEASVIFSLRIITFPLHLLTNDYYQWNLYIVENKKEKDKFPSIFKMHLIFLRYAKQWWCVGCFNFNFCSHRFSSISYFSYTLSPGL